MEVGFCGDGFPCAGEFKLVEDYIKICGLIFGTEICVGFCGLIFGTEFEFVGDKMEGTDFARVDLVPKKIPINLVDEKLNLPYFQDWKFSKKNL